VPEAAAGDLEGHGSLRKARAVAACAKYRRPPRSCIPPPAALWAASAPMASLQMQAMQEAAQLGAPQLAADRRRARARCAQEPRDIGAGVAGRPTTGGVRADQRQQPLQLAIADAELVEVPERVDEIVEVVAGAAAAGADQARLQGER